MFPGPDALRIANTQIYRFIHTLVYVLALQPIRAPVSTQTANICTTLTFFAHINRATRPLDKPATGS